MSIQEANRVISKVSDYKNGIRYHTNFLVKAEKTRTELLSNSEEAKRIRGKLLIKDFGWVEVGYKLAEHSHLIYDLPLELAIRPDFVDRYLKHLDNLILETQKRIDHVKDQLDRWENDLEGKI